METSMINDITRTINRSIEEVVLTQRTIAENRIYMNGLTENINGREVKVRTGHLLESLQNSHSRFTMTDDTLSYSSDVPLYMRFLDMKENGNLKIYNKPLYGMLYYQALPAIKYKYGIIVRKHVSRLITEAVEFKK